MSGLWVCDYYRVAYDNKAYRHITGVELLGACRNYLRKEILKKIVYWAKYGGAQGCYVCNHTIRGILDNRWITVSRARVIKDITSETRRARLERMIKMVLDCMRQGQVETVGAT